MSDQRNKTGEMGSDQISETEPGFDVHELAACPACGRSNGPDRQSCIYCGKALAKTNRNVGTGQLRFRGLEPWELGMNLIVVPTRESEPNINSAAGILNLDVGVLTDMLEKQTPLPLARLENKDIADEISTALRELGIDVRVIDDKEIGAEHPPVRIRSIEVDDTKVGFVDFNTGEKYPVAFSDVLLIVSGGIFESRREEVTKRKRGSTEVLDEFESASDQRVLDIFTSQNSVGFRINTNGFDFSVLGDEKDLFASKNIIILRDLFSTLFPNAIIADEYDSVRDLLEIAWPVTVSKDLHGLQMRGYGKREFGVTYTTSNHSQFTKYSRMRRLLI